MNRENAAENAGQGRLPAQAPLANPYVPFQMENPPHYEAGLGLVRGTLFPGLELPFLGMVNQKELAPTPLAELQALDFAMYELALYLDTHRQDRDALELYRTYQQLYSQGRQRYEAEFGPLGHGTPSEQDSYAWLDAPWPWEYSGNKEG